MGNYYKRSVLINGVRYSSIKEAVEKTGISEATLYRRLNSPTYCENDPIKVRPHKTPVMVDGVKYGSILEACTQLGTQHSCLKRRICSKNPIYAGYVYLEEAD
jgi:hypothetical protein